MQTSSISPQASRAAHLGRPAHPPRADRPHRLARTRRAATVLIAAGALLLGLAPAAAAHVTVNTEKPATSGSYAKLTFRVPTESDTASTVKLTIALPEEHPLPSVSLLQVPGWTAETSRTDFDPPVETGRFVLTDAITSVTWTADEGVGIAPGEFGEFALSVGPLPEAEQLVFRAAQHYSDGSVVNWDEVAVGDEHPDHPAPILTITSAAADAAAAGAAAPEPHHADIDSAEAASQLLGAIALAVAFVALVLAVWALLRSNRKKADL